MTKKLCLKLLFLTLLINISTISFAGGKSKPGRYVERYDIPMLYYEDNKTTCRGGKMVIYVDIEGANALCLAFYDSNNEYLEHWYLLDEPAPIVIHKTKHESVLLTSGNEATFTESYEIRFGDFMRLVFATRTINDNSNTNTLTFTILEADKETGKQIKGQAYIYANFGNISMEDIRSVMNEASRRNAIRLIER